MSWSIQADEMLNGAEVYGSDGDKVGTVAAVYPAYIVVEQGFLFPTDFFIPRSAIGSVDTDRIYLTATKDATVHSGWHVPPTDLASATPGTTPGNRSDAKGSSTTRSPR